MKDKLEYYITNMYISIKKGKLYLLLIIIAYCSTYFLLNRGIILFDDGFFPFNPYQSLLNELSLFNYPYFLGAPYNYTYNYIPFTLFTLFFVGVLHLPYWVDDFLYIGGLQSIGSIGTFRLIKKLPPSGNNSNFLSIGAFFGSLFFMFNFNKVITINEFYPIFISISLLPLLSSYILDFYKNSRLKFKALFYIGILSFIMASGYYEATFTMIIAIGVLSFILYSLLNFPGSMKEKLLKTLTIILIIALTSIWIIPSLLFNTFAGFYNAPSTLSGASVLMNELYYNHRISLLSLITFDYPAAGFSILPIILGKDLSYYLWATIALFFLTQLFLFLPRQNSFRNIIKYFDAFIFILFIVGIIDWPVQILLYHFVFGILFTLTISWEFWIFQLWFSIIMGLTITAFLSLQKGTQKNSKLKRNQYNITKISQRNIKSLFISCKKWTPAILMCILISTYSIPIAGYQGMSTGYTTSSYHPSHAFVSTGKFLSEHSGQGNILEFPVIAGDYKTTGNHSIWTVSSPLSSFTSSFMDYRDRVGVNNTLTYPIFNKFQAHPNGNLSNYISLYGIKYIVISKNVNASFESDYNSSTYMALQDYFNSTKGYSFINSYGNYTIFSLNNTNPIIYASNAYVQNYFVRNNSTLMLYNAFIKNKLTPGNDSVFYGLKNNITNVNEKNVRINWNQTSLNSYDINIKSNISFALNFLKGYSTQWGSYHWLLKIDGEGIDHCHYVSNLFANGWILPKGNYSATIYLSYSELQTITYIVSFIPLIVLLIFPVAMYIKTIFPKKER